MNTPFGSPLTDSGTPGEARPANMAQGSYNVWFGTLQEAPLYTEIFRAAQLNEFFHLEERRRPATHRSWAPLRRVIGAEARKLWNHLLDRRRN